MSSILDLANQFEKLAQSHTERAVKLFDTLQRMRYFITKTQPILLASGPEARTYFDDNVASILPHWPLKAREPVPAPLIKALGSVHQAFIIVGSRGVMTNSQMLRIRMAFSDYMTQGYGRYLRDEVKSVLFNAIREINRSFVEDAKRVDDSELDELN